MTEPVASRTARDPVVDAADELSQRDALATATTADTADEPVQRARSVRFDARGVSAVVASTADVSRTAAAAHDSRDEPSAALAARRVRLRWWRGALVLFALLELCVFALERRGGGLQSAILWWPSGVAVAGLWLLGRRAWWIVLLGSALMRVGLGYAPTNVWIGAIGSTAEALLGATLLQRLQVEPRFARLRDVVALAAVAACAPLASLVASWITRSLTSFHLQFPIHTGWAEWWRMNALGVLLAVPLASTWRGAVRRARPARAWLVFAALAATALGGVAAIFAFATPGPLGILWLYLVLPVALYAALRFGPLGALTLSALVALAVSFGTSVRLGPFLAIAESERHVVLQAFELSLVALPLVFGALVAERESALESRVRSDAVTRAIQRFLPDVTYHVRGDGTIVDVHAPPGERTLEVGGKLAELLPPRAAECLPQRLNETLRGATAEPLEFEREHDGRRRSYEAYLVRLANDEALALVHDVTARERSAEADRWESRVLLEIATGSASARVLGELVAGVESSCDGAQGCALLLEGRRLHVLDARRAEPARAPAADATTHALVPRELRDALDGRAIGADDDPCGLAAHGGRAILVADFERDARWPEFGALASRCGVRACWSVPIRDAAGQVLGVFAFCFRAPRAPTPADLALVERASALAGIALERERREGLLTSIHRSVNEGIFRSTPEQGIVYVNEACVRMFGYETAAQMLRIDPRALYVDPERRARMLRRLVEHGAVTSDELHLRRRDGTTFWGLVSSIVVHGADGRIVAFDGAVSDVTTRRKLEEELRQAQKMEAVGRLAGGIAHDFNNLLTAINGYTELLLDDLPLEGRARGAAEQVLSSTGRAASLTRQLLAYSRQQVLEPQVLDLTVVVDQLGLMLRRLIGEHIRLSIRHAERGAYVLVDRGQIEQVLLNLALNSRDAMPTSGELVIATEPLQLGAEFAAASGGARAGPHVMLSVMDNGHGMDAETSARAFDPFFTTKDKGKGTGLGLSMVYGIVRQSDGVISLRSVPGVGTTVFVYLPRLPAPQERAAAGAPQPIARAGPATILVAEDESSVRAILTQTLADAGFDVLEACDGAEALEMASDARHSLDLVVTDLIMPRMGGRELAQQLQRVRPNVPVLVVSGYAVEPARPREGADVDGRIDGHFLQKPFTRAQLLQRVGAILARRR